MNGVARIPIHPIVLRARGGGAEAPGSSCLPRPWLWQEINHALLKHANNAAAYRTASQSSPGPTAGQARRRGPRKRQPLRWMAGAPKEVTAAPDGGALFRSVIFPSILRATASLGGFFNSDRTTIFCGYAKTPLRKTKGSTKQNLFAFFFSKRKSW